MRRSLFILLLLGAGALWLARSWTDKTPPSPGLGPASPEPPARTLESAARDAAPLLRDLRRELDRPAPSSPSGPAIHLKAQTIEPKPNDIPSSSLLEHPRPSARGVPLMVLFEAPIRGEWRSLIDQAGGVIRAYLPENALLLEAPEAAWTDIRQSEGVVWSGEYRPAHKVQALLAATSRKAPGLHVPITLQTFAPEDATWLAAELAEQGASDIRAVAARRWGLVRAVLPAGEAVELARWPEVQWVEIHEPPRLLNDRSRAADRLNVDTVFAQEGLDGNGQIVAIADTGLDTGNTNTLHPDFDGRLMQVFDIGRLTNWSDRYYHGTHVAASLLGTGAASDGQFRGVAPGARMVFQSIMRANNTLALPDDLNELYLPPYDLGARIHNNSWGSPVYGEYNSDSMTTDEFIWDHPDMLVVYAAGNDGEDLDRNGVVDLMSLNSPATAKNVLSVGASESGRPPGGGGRTSSTYGQVWNYWFRTPPISTDYISSSPEGEPQGMVAFSSRGPTEDGRTKPDVVAPGSDIISARSRSSSDNGWGLYAANTNYCFLGGTSMAAPLAAGAATLVRQYAVEHLGMASPSAALLKAALIGGAASLTPGQYGTGAYREIPQGPRPNLVEGWGQVNLGETLFPEDGCHSILLESPGGLASGESHSLEFQVHQNLPLTVVMAYSDYPASLAASVQRVNDLDLVLLAPDGTLHHPNGLDGPDSINNVEGVDVPEPMEGLWTLEIHGRNVPQGPQPYALYLRGALHMPVSIAHHPLPNTTVTSGSYRVTAEVTSPAPFDPESVRLFWNTDPEVPIFYIEPMSTEDGRHFEAEIPAQPVGTTLAYYLMAGEEAHPAYDPPTAPAETHSFDVTPALSLTIFGTPSNAYTVVPAYGTHLLASNLTLHAQALPPPDDSIGYRTACVGWMGTGSVPSSGDTDHVEFTLTEDSTLTWLWQEQVALVHTSRPYGAIAATTWHPLDESVSSLAAPESHTFNKVPLTFSGWEMDGVRHPAAPLPSRRHLHDIPMSSPRILTATYLATDLDSDDNGLPDWFEWRYFGQLGQDRYGDPDGDGFENEIEAADHTDPFDPDSFPTPPVILHDPLTSPRHTPAPWTISATITDNYRVATAMLHWQRNAGAWRSAPMSPSSGSLFSAQIPSPVRDGDQVVYYLTATDPAGFIAQSPSWTVHVAYARMTAEPSAIETAAPAQSQTNLNLTLWNTGSQPLQVQLDIAPIGFWDDVESGTNQWTRPDGNSDWNIDAYRSFSPDHAWYCGQAATRTYRNSTHAALVSPPVQLGAGAPRLDFMHWARFEPDVDVYTDGRHYWDSGVLEISNNNGLTWQFLVPEGGYPGLISSNPVSPFAPFTPCFVDTDGWEPVAADLSAYAGQEVRLRFRFGADRYVVAEGWYLDDIQVTPRTEYDGWLTLPVSQAEIPAGLGLIFPVQMDTSTLPPMASGHLAIRVHHNDPERPSPLVVPVSLHNTTRRVRVTHDGPGATTPSGEHLRQPGEPFHVEFEAYPGHFIADIQTNAESLYLTDVLTEYGLNWPELDGNLDIHAIFTPLLEPGLVPLDWLATYGLTNRHWMAEASLDHDGDGLLTWQEHQLGSDPLDPADAPLVVRILKPEPPDDDWRVSWHAFTNLNDAYSILTTTNLTMGFTAFTNLPAAPPTMTSPPLPANHRFFGILRE